MMGVSRHDRNFKSNFDGVRTRIARRAGNSPIDNSINNRIYDSIHKQALTCRHCSAPVIAEVTTKLYNLDLYEDQKVNYRHPADPNTICDVLERVATEIRLLDIWDSNDYAYDWRL
jgi:hypothetical protein